MKDYKKMFLYVLLVVIGLSLYNKWQFEHPQIVNNSVAVAPANNTTVRSNVPTVPSASNTTASATKNMVPETQKLTTIKHGKLIWVTTDVLHVAIDTLGGNIVQAHLLHYVEKTHSKNKFQLLNNTTDKLYIAQSGLTGKNGPDTAKGQVTYRSNANRYTLATGQNTIVVKLYYTKSGVEFIKRFTFKRNNYAVQQTYDIVNHSAQTWQGNFYTQLVRHGTETHHSLTHAMAFTGAAVSSPSDRFKKLSFSDLQNANYSETNKQGWVAMVQHYFLSAWVPNPTQNYHYYSRANNNVYTIGMISPALTVAPKQQVTTTATLYMGPAIASRLEAVAPHLKMTIDYGWLWFISVLLFWVLKHVHDFLGNWGRSIVVVTILITAGVFYI